MSPSEPPPRPRSASRYTHTYRVVASFSEAARGSRGRAAKRGGPRKRTRARSPGHPGLLQSDVQAFACQHGAHVANSGHVHGPVRHPAVRVRPVHLGFLVRSKAPDSASRLALAWPYAQAGPVKPGRAARCRAHAHAGARSRGSRPSTLVVRARTCPAGGQHGARSPLLTARVRMFTSHHPPMEPVVATSAAEQDSDVGGRIRLLCADGRQWPSPVGSVVRRRVSRLGPSRLSLTRSDGRTGCSGWTDWVLRVDGLGAPDGRTGRSGWTDWASPLRLRALHSYVFSISAVAANVLFIGFIMMASIGYAIVRTSVSYREKQLSICAFILYSVFDLQSTICTDTTLCQAYQVCAPVPVHELRRLIFQRLPH